MQLRPQVAAERAALDVLMMGVPATICTICPISASMNCVLGNEQAFLRVKISALVAFSHPLAIRWKHKGLEGVLEK